MYKFENKLIEKWFYNRAETPSFSSFVFDKILRIIDEEDRNNSDKKFNTETTVNKMSKINDKCNRFDEDEPNFHLKIHHDRDQDVMFFNSTPNSSGSSSSTPSYSSSSSSSVLLSSSSDTESVSPCFVHSKSKPVIARDEEIFIKPKSKSRAMKLYNNLKTVKQPISPGGKLITFLSSLFINTKKTKTVSSHEYVNADRKGKSKQTSSYFSASSFLRSCVSKNSSTSRDKSRNGGKRTVRFCPVSVIVDEDNRVCGNKCLHGDEEDSGLTASPVPVAWKIGRSVSKKKEHGVLNMNKRVDDVLREFHLNRELLSMRKNDKDHGDIASCSSSDLFELDHLALIRNDRYYYEDLHVFETTSFRSICIM